MRLLKPLWIAAVLLLVAAFVLFLAFAKLYRIPGSAMSPSLRPGGRVLVIRFAGPVKPDRGDIVAYHVTGAGRRAGGGSATIPRPVPGRPFS